MSAGLDGFSIELPFRHSKCQSWAKITFFPQTWLTKPVTCLGSTQLESLSGTDYNLPNISLSSLANILTFFLVILRRYRTFLHI